MLINETMARQLGWETAVGKWFNFQDREMRIVGVMRDFNFRSFHETVAPLALHLGEDWPFSRVLVKMRSDGMQATLAHLDATMATFSPASPFTYEFLDDAYSRMYQTEVRLGRLFSYFTGLALIIACLGLLGLAAFTSAQRTKEIGIRKVLGATLADILVLISREFLKLVAIAFVIATPVAYFVMRRWLESFAYRIEIGVTVFLFTLALVLLSAILTVSYQSIKAALADPVKSLRHP
jgi:putative ABC transport system permease protein